MTGTSRSRAFYDGNYDPAIVRHEPIILLVISFAGKKIQSAFFLSYKSINYAANRKVGRIPTLQLFRPEIFRRPGTDYRPFRPFCSQWSLDIPRLQRRGGHHSGEGGMAKGSGWADSFLSICPINLPERRACKKACFFWYFIFAPKKSTEPLCGQLKRISCH